MKKNLWPNFFIVGAPRSGTTSLYEYLKNVSSIYMSSEKEPTYFTTDNQSIIGIDCEKTIKYLKLFENVKNKTIIGEATATYLWDTMSYSLIHKMSPDAKILISLRNPVDRLISHYKRISNEFDLGSFHTFIFNPPEKFKEYSKTFYEFGFYFEQVKRYFDIFGKNNVKVIIFEEFLANEESVIKEILKFLNIDANISDIDFRVYNASFTPKGSWVRPIMRSRLIKKIASKVLKDQSKIEDIKEKFLKKSKELQVSVEDKKNLTDRYFDDVLKLEKLLEIKLPWFENDEN
ncbi:MAG: sulfotransferase [Bacteroidetes bacterium]|nr:sulfotransferase [Bacteroidota bacterium]